MDRYNPDEYHKLLSRREELEKELDDTKAELSNAKRSYDTHLKVVLGALCLTGLRKNEPQSLALLPLMYGRASKRDKELLRNQPWCPDDIEERKDSTKEDSKKEEETKEEETKENGSPPTDPSNPLPSDKPNEPSS